MRQADNFQAEVAILALDSTQHILEEINSTVDNIFYRSLLQSCFAYLVNAAIFDLRDCTLNDDGELYGPGLYWTGDGFAIAEMKVPRLAENRTEIVFYKREGKFPPGISAWLDQAVLLNGHSVYTSKKHLPAVLTSRGLGAYVIPTHRVRSFEDIVQGMKTYRSCVIKPIASSKGVGVSFVEKEGDTLYCRNFYEESILTEETWKELLGVKKYILQPCMDFHNQYGNALHFRMLVSKGKEGQWEPAMIHALIGTNRFVSNGSHGGTSTFAEEILAREFSEDAVRIIEEMHYLCRAVPEALEYYTKEISIYGIDVAVDRESKQLYVIEVNIQPASDYSPWHLAEKRVRYFRHLLGRPIKDDSVIGPLKTSLLASHY